MPNIHGSCTVLVAARAGARPPLVSHSFDTSGGVDTRLVRVPPNPNPPNPRPVFCWDENAVPRFFGVGRGPIPAYAEWVGEQSAPPEPIGFIAQTEDPAGTLGYWEAASGIANDAGVMMAESTCSAIFGALPRGKDGGQALLGYMELSRIALERCTSAKAAVELMGALAVEHGFCGNTDEGMGTAESLTVVDSEEAWIMHILADDSGASAIWAAQRVQDGHAAVVPNMFVIRKMKLDAADGADSFMLSDSARECAARHNLWKPGTPFDFAAIFSRGEARNKYYCGRRLWRALSLFAPSLNLPAAYDDLLTDTPYPFSVVPDGPLDRHFLFRVMRDTYAATVYDLSAQPASGPFGLTDRYDDVAYTSSVTGGRGMFERPIGIYRMACTLAAPRSACLARVPRLPHCALPLASSYPCACATDSYVGEPQDASGRPAAFHFAPHVSQTSVYLPVLCTMERCPSPLGRGTVRAIDRAAAYWAFRIVKQTIRGLPWDRCLALIQARQQQWEIKAGAILEGGGGEGTSEAVHALAEAVVDDWWLMLDELLLRFGDGWEYDWDEASGAARHAPLKYPMGWLEHVGFFEEKD